MTIPAGAAITLDIDFKFIEEFALPADLTVLMRAPSATGKGRPYVVTVTVLPKHDR
ncbi:hypothetical protein D3C72_1335510 [compost metagenome]